MNKYRALPGKTIVKSRGIEQECGNGIYIPSQYLDDSDVCTVEESGVRVLRKRGMGTPIGDSCYILADEHIIGVYADGRLQPVGNHILLRKCLDPDEEIVTPGTRKTQFAEILAAGDDSALKDYVGNLAYVDLDGELPQKVEDTIDDWIVHEDSIEFVIGE